MKKFIIFLSFLSLSLTAMQDKQQKYEKIALPHVTFKKPKAKTGKSLASMAAITTIKNPILLSTLKSMQDSEQLDAIIPEQVQEKLAEHIKVVESFSLEEKKIIHAVEYSPLGSYIATRTTDIVTLWDAKTGNCVTSFSNDEPIRSLAFSFDEKRIALACNNNIAKVFDITSMQPKLIYTLKHNSIVYSVSFSCVNNYIATSSHDKTVQIWDGVSGNCLHTLEHDNQVQQAIFNPSSTLVATEDDAAVKVWNISTGKCVKTIKLEDRVQAILFKSDNELIVAAKNIIRVLSIENSDTHRLNRLKIKVPTNVISVSINKDSNKLLAVLENDCTLLIDLKTKAFIKKFNLTQYGTLSALNFENYPPVAIFNPTNNAMAITYGNQVTIFDEEGQLVKAFQYTQSIHHPTFSPNGKFLTIASDKSAHGISVELSLTEKLLITGQLN